MLAWTFRLDRPYITYDSVAIPTRMICFAAKWLDEDAVIFRSEYHHGTDVMLRKLAELLNEADIVLHFNGDRFDIQHGIDMFSPIVCVDIYKQLRNSMYFPNNKLDTIIKQLGIGKKSEHEGIGLWIKCITDPPADDPNRQRRAWALMRRYCKNDVVKEEELYLDTREWFPKHPNLSLWEDDPAEDRCSVCNSPDYLKPDGYAYTNVGKYPKWRCMAPKGGDGSGVCGKYGRSKKAVALIDVRGVAS
jgi:hypothetical protein